MFIAVLFPKLFNFIFIYLSYPASLKLLLIYRDSNWNIQVTLIEANVFFCANSDELSILPVRDRPFNRWAYYSIFLTPIIKPYVFFFFLYFACDFPIRLKILN